MSEALRLADELEYDWGARFMLIKSAAELRRLHAENEAMKEALKEAEKLDADANALAVSSRALADSVDQLRALNAELVGVLQSIAATFDDSWMEHSVERVMGDKARAALAKAGK